MDTANHLSNTRVLRWTGMLKKYNVALAKVIENDRKYILCGIYMLPLHKIPFHIKPECQHLLFSSFPRKN